jgi:hypothetical protein
MLLVIVREVLIAISAAPLVLTTGRLFLNR